MRRLWRDLAKCKRLHTAVFSLVGGDRLGEKSFLTLRYVALRFPLGIVFRLGLEDKCRRLLYGFENVRPLQHVVFELQKTKIEFQPKNIFAFFIFWNDCENGVLLLYYEHAERKLKKVKFKLLASRQLTKRNRTLTNQQIEMNQLFQC